MNFLAINGSSLMYPIRFWLVSLLATFAPLLAAPAHAQLSVDQTLDAESSVITPDVNIDGQLADFVEGGATRGPNLFHSFSSFNIDEAQRVYFDSPAGIESILSRVTGDNLSTIDGVLGTTGDSNAALILMNPNGIVFGENASLDVQGAFTATTASGVQLGERGSFSAVEPEVDSLLSVSPSAFLFNSQTSIRPEILVEAGQGVNGGLFVPEGETLLLLGGNVTLDGGSIGARGGRVELGALADTGVVDISNDSVSIADEIEKGDIRLENGALVEVRAAVGGDVIITANDISVLSGSLVLGGIQAGLGERESQSGSVILKATGSVEIAGDGTVLENAVGRDASGQAGDVTIQAGSVAVGEGSTISSATLGVGDAGNIVIEARKNISLGQGFVANFVDLDASGQGGDIVVTAINLEAANGAQLGSATFGAGDAGSIVLNIEKTARFDGAHGNSSTFVFTVVGEDSSNQGGNIEITASNLDVINGARVAADTLGAGKAGSVIINVAERFRLSGLNAEAGAFSFVTSNAGAGQGGNVEISAASLEVTEGASISSSTLGEGDAGSVVLNIDGTALFDGSNPVDIASIGISAGDLASGVRTITLSEGRAGNIEILATNLVALNGAQITASTFGSGDAGNVVLDIFENIQLDGSSPLIDRVPTAISSAATSSASGKGGVLEISASNLEVTGGGQISVSTSGSGDAGSVTISVTERARFDGTNRSGFPSGVFSSADAEAEVNGGSLKLTATGLEVTNGALLEAASIGGSDAGDIDLNVSRQISVNNGGISTLSGNGSGGEITIRAGGVVLRNDGDIQTDVIGGQGNGGDITLSSSYIVALEDSDILAFSEGGRGGDINLGQTTLFTQNLSRVSSVLDSENLSALDGNSRVDINATGSIESGTISVNDSSFVENSLSELTETLVDIDTLVASSCVVNRDDAVGSLTIQRSDRPTQSPTSPLPIPYSLGTVQPVPTTQPVTIQEPQSVYQLPDGRLVISRRCE